MRVYGTCRCNFIYAHSKKYGLPNAILHETQKCSTTFGIFNQIGQQIWEIWVKIRVVDFHCAELHNIHNY
jgi:hypothetical protein